MDEMVERCVAAARAELERQASGEGELYYRTEDGFVDGRVDLHSLVRAVLAAKERADG